MRWPQPSSINQTEAERAVEKADGLTQVFPEHKYHIVELLQHKGHIVGMTVDGVNDALRLARAWQRLMIRESNPPPQTIHAFGPIGDRRRRGKHGNSV